MIKIPRSKISRPSFHLSMLLGKPCFNYCLFYLLLTCLLFINPSIGCHSPRKNWILPLSFIPYPISPVMQIIYWKKVSLIAFRQILPKILSVLYIFSFIIRTYLKKFTGIKSLSTKQCPAELSPWIISHVSPFYQKCITSFYLACDHYHVWTALPFPRNLPFAGIPVDGGKILSSSKKKKKKNPHFPHQKNPPHQIAIFM